MDIRQMRYFIALYEERSITRAAKRLHVVQPAVSMQIRKLEMDYGLTLFERTTHGVFPNALAQQLYPLCQKVLGDLGVASSFLKEAKGKITGSVSAGVPPSLAHSCLADIVAEFCVLYPDVRLTVHEGYTSHLLEWLADGLLELAVVHGLDAERRLQVTPLMTERLVVAMASEIAAGRSAITGAELSMLRMALPSGENLTRLLMDEAFLTEGLTLEPAVELDSLAAVLNLIRRPGWATILPSAAVAARQIGKGIARLTLTKPTISRSLVVATRPGTDMSVAAKLFVGQMEIALNFAASAAASHQAV
jgi:LysR family transcriptional regulator, nitrogen assimilation regulatory protein